MKRVHYIDNYLLNPQHPVTVNLIGAGGTGSQVLTCLSRNRPIYYRDTIIQGGKAASGKREVPDHRGQKQ